MNILIGSALLFFGRSLFWLFVGGIGFVAGFEIASDAMTAQPQWVILAIAVGAGLVAALLSIFLQRLVVAVAGFFAGGYFLSSLADALWQHHPSAVRWVAYLVGGVVGALLTAALLDPALIVLSSLAGATAICQHVPLDESGRGILFMALLALGIVVQSIHYGRTRRAGTARREADRQ
ncbi:MAG TPA: DUF4203 domain-containing protein, partial [Verrucomicrobiae bacterium]|nr:DUF4203 domain-containing protein [Verrucomicrobiae bacterium]